MAIEKNLSGYVIDVNEYYIWLGRSVLKKNILAKESIYFKFLNSKE